MVEVDVGDEGSIRQRHLVVEHLVAEVGRDIDQQRLVGHLVVDVYGKSRALDPQLAGALAGVTVTARGRRSRRVARPEQGHLHQWS